MFDLMKRLKNKLIPTQIKNTGEYYISAPDYGAQAVPLSVWRLGKKRPPQDFWGNTGRIYSQQVLTTQGPLLFALKVVPSAGLGGNSGLVFGQTITPPVAGFAGRPAQITPYSTAAEWNAVNATGNPGKQLPDAGYLS